MFIRTVPVRLSSFVAGVLAVATLAACSSSDSTGSGGTGGSSSTGTGSSTSAATGTGGGMTGPKTADPSAATQAIWTQIQGYSAWPTFAENPTPKASMSHMGMFVVAHHNDVVASAITNKTLPLPDGALIVKDNFMTATDAMPMAVTVMAKQGGKWYWIEATPDGKVILDPTDQPLEGAVAMCTGCHDGASSNDDVLTHDFTK